MTNYPTNITDSQWQVIKDFLNLERKRKYELREITNGILYLVKTGCQWRMLPKDFPKWQLVYYYFKRWQSEGIIKKIQHFLVKKIRQHQGRDEQPSIGIIDSQSIKSTLVSSREHTGFDGGKRIKGIKRHIVVDASGMLLSVRIHPASMADRKGAVGVLDKLRKEWSSVGKIFADGGYPLPGRAGERIQSLCGYIMEVVRKTDMHTFKVLPKRWVVERTFAWIETNRRNAKSYERLPATAEAITQLSAMRIMLKNF